MRAPSRITRGGDRLRRHIAAGDEHLQVVEGTDLLGPERADGLVDGTHPNDLEFQWMAEGLAPRPTSPEGVRANRRLAGRHHSCGEVELADRTEWWVNGETARATAIQ